MGSILIIIIGLVEAVGLAAAMYVIVSKKKSTMGGAADKLEDELKLRQGYETQINSLFAGLVKIDQLVQQADIIRNLQESLKAERGRITITQAELETVETRLRELDEIERELEASSLETKEELKILKRKEGDLGQKNSTLKQQLEITRENMSKILTDIQLSAEMQDQIRAMQSEIMSCEQKIDDLLLRIEQGNEQYFILKSRYDALDIEYAQLYEKFAEAEEPKESK